MKRSRCEFGVMMAVMFSLSGIAGAGRHWQMGQAWGDGPQQPQIPVTPAPQRPWQWNPPQQPQIPVTAAPQRPWQWTPLQQQQPQIPVTAAPQRPWQWTPPQQPQMPVTAAPQRPWQWTPPQQQQPQIPFTVAPQRPWQWTPPQQQQPQMPVTAAPQRPWQWTPPQQPHQPRTHATAPPQRPLLWTQPQLPKQPQNPDSPAWGQKCNVAPNEKVQCGTPDITAEQCETISCCFDGQECYYARAVTVQCTKDGQFVVVVARDSTLPQLDLQSVSLLEENDASCRPAGTTAAFVIFQFAVTACGTTLAEDQGVVVYENSMSSSYEVGIGPRGSITRDSHFYLHFQCRYSGTSVETLIFEVNKVPAPRPVIIAGPLRVELRLGSGQCHAKGCAEEVYAYTSYYTAADYPVTKVMREPVYVEVRILERTDPDIVLTLEHCWATNRPNPDYVPQWDLLIDGCPYQDDRYLTAVVPVDESSGLVYPTHYKRFVFKMFAWVFGETFAPEPEQVFIHCATAVCHPSSTTSCEQRCHRKRRHVESQRAAPDQVVVVSSGALVMTPPH